ncbi:MAG TPA: hypothetical protein PLT48_16115 [Nitrospira sp.]|nr:hypothetical protein [Nitrospira sp.]HNB42679.1 hypothetical protein [Burkholderiaceae bacterium]HNG78834.1 hypothetical protein [Burkholderiaceae bacterium]
MSASDPTFAQNIDDVLPNTEFSVEDMLSPEGNPVESGDPTQPGSAATAGVPANSQSTQSNALTPVPIPLNRAVSGRYRGTLGSFQLELRVDVDRTRPMNRASGDLYQVSGGTTTYYGSFVLNSPVVTVTATTVTVKGLGTFTFSAGAPVVQITIARRTLFQSQAPATLQFFTTAGSPGATYTCAFESAYFRTVRIETDRVSDVTTPVFGSYNTGSLPSGGSSRTLSVPNAYAEAGVEMIQTAGSDVINISEAGADIKWTNAELHAAMQKHFTLWSDNPQWAVWLLAAQSHEIGPTLYGIMFDQQGKQRQGCAVFHTGIGGTTAEKLRLQLYTYVHELGHCFNLLHSWQKAYATPPVPNRPNSLSWMNYPWNFPNGGAAAFWNQFPFQFDQEEVIHLRHAFRNNIIMGGNPFGTGSALGREVMADPIRDDSGLSFRISTHQDSFALGEPVVLQMALGATDSRERRVHTWLNPNCGMVKVVIRKPSGEVVAYEPLIDHLVGARDTTLRGRTTVKDSAYIGFGKEGFYFDQPGNYRIRASYAALDGSEVLSEVIKVRVRYPVTAAEESLAALFMGDDQGTLLCLLGSDSETLNAGNAAFDEVLDRHGKHPMANYARAVKGINAARDFKTVTTDKQVELRPARLDESAKLLSAVADSGVLDSVSTQMVIANLASVQARAGDEAAAQKTLATLSALKSAAD